MPAEVLYIAESSGATSKLLHSSVVSTDTLNTAVAQLRRAQAAPVLIANSAEYEALVARMVPPFKAVDARVWRSVF